MTPDELIDSPAGAPDSDHEVMVAPPAEPEVVAETVTVGEMAVPAVEIWLAGAVTVTTLLMV